MKILRKNRSVLALGLTALLVLASTLSFRLYYENNEPKLPDVALHQDIPSQHLTSFQQSLLVKRPLDSSPYPGSSCAHLPKNWVITENKKQGMPYKTYFWQVLSFSNPDGSVLWLDKTSVSCGETVTVRASTYNSFLPNFSRGPRTIQVIRIGWYGGSGARLVWKSEPIKFLRQRIPFASTATRMIETNWKPTATFTVGSDWTPGFYQVNTISPSGKLEGTAPLIVRSPMTNSPLLLVHSTMTWAAYNTFGGRSLYLGPGDSAEKRMKERSRIVSMDRPIIGSGAVHIHRDAISLVQFLEKEGFSVDQVADTDVDQWPSIIKPYNSLVFSGHPEYFTRRLFDTVAAARNTGINLAFLGANTAYWQTRLEASPTGNNRHVVVYRFPKEDPITAPTAVTVQFQDKRINTPDWLLTGGKKAGVHVYGSIHAVKIPTWLKIPANAVLRGWAAESEIERRGPAPAEPPNVHVLFSGVMNLVKPILNGKKPPIRMAKEETLWFTLPSGAAVFNAGISMWTCDLMPTCNITTVDEKTRTLIQSITKQVLTLWEQKGIAKVLK